jgi:hypothetical protein
VLQSTSGAQNPGSFAFLVVNSLKKVNEDILRFTRAQDFLPIIFPLTDEDEHQWPRSSAAFHPRLSRSTQAFDQNGMHGRVAICAFLDPLNRSKTTRRLTASPNELRMPSGSRMNIWNPCPDFHGNNAHKKAL